MTMQQNNKGFVILFAVLISAIVLMIAAGIFGISFKETVLSSTARESSIALNAADAAVECALLLDIKQGLLDPAQTGQSCNGQSINLSPRGGSGATFEFFMDDTQGQEGCALVSVERVVTTGTATTIYARGFNLCDASGPLFGDPLLVERVYEVYYAQQL